MRNHVRLRLVCGGVGLGILPAFELYVFLIDHLSPDLPKWPMFSVFLLCPPVLFVNLLAAGRGDYAYLYTGLAIVALLNGGIYAVVGPAFWRLSKNIKESVSS
jgi:hypothetical protein